MTEQQKRTVGVAVASLVLGILGLLLLGPLCAVPSVICGHIAKSKIKQDPEHLTGDGVALAGLIMGYVQIGLMVMMIPLLAAVALPSFYKARTRARVQATRSKIAMLSRAIDQYTVETGRNPSSLASLIERDGSPGWNGPYIREQVVDAWGTPLAYEMRDGDASIISAGPDRTVGTGDDITSP